jgi:integrase
MDITDANLETAVCPPNRKDMLVFDDHLKGFGVRLTDKGKRVFIFQYRAGAKVRRTVLGTWGDDLSAAKARRKAESLRGQVVDARDPVAERRAAKAEAERKEAQERAERAAAQYTVDALITQWTDLHLAERSASYRKRVPIEMRRMLKTWLTIPAATFSHVDAVRALDATKVSAGPIAANRGRAVARACWAWAVKRGALPSNPWEKTPKPSKEEARERVLTDLEIGDLWHAAGTMDDPWRGLFRAMILTGQRRSEVAGMRWDELDLAKGLWTLPGARTKNRHSHIIPLVPELVALIRRMPRREGAELVFEGARKTAPSGFGKLKAKLDLGMQARAAERSGKFAQWTLHDIRRTCATNLQRLGVRLEVTEAILNHVSGSRGGIVGVYQRHGWETEKTEALKAWTLHVLVCAGVIARRPTDNVIDIQANKRRKLRINGANKPGTEAEALP